MRVFGLIATSMLLAACSSKAPTTVQQSATLALSYQAFHPITSELLVEWKQTDLRYSPATAQLFDLFSGEKLLSSKTVILQDPFHQHDPSLLQEMPTMILREIWENIDSTQETINFAGKDYQVVEIISEEGIEKLVLDENPYYLVRPAQWVLTLDSIKE